MSYSFDEQITLGVLEELLKSQPDRVLSRGLSNPHSYRGYYEDVAFQLEDNVTIEEMLSSVRSAIGEDYSGYKGGKFHMDKNTVVWIANWGDTGEPLSPLLCELLFGFSPSDEGESL